MQSCCSQEIHLQSCFFFNYCVSKNEKMVPSFSRKYLWLVILHDAFYMSNWIFLNLKNEQIVCLVLKNNTEVKKIQIM